MAIISPINLAKWQPNTPILSSQARAEFMNIYNLVNGNLDSANIMNGMNQTAQANAQGRGNMVGGFLQGGLGVLGTVLGALL